MKKEYDVALSFAGEDRQPAEKLAKLLKSNGYTVFYDQFELDQLWGKNLYDHLSTVYKDKARYCVMFLSKNYAQKLWTNHERQSAQARALEENQEYILPVRLDDTEIPGILPTIGYLDLCSMTIEEIYQVLAKKLSGTASQTETDDLPTTSAQPNRLLENPKLHVDLVKLGKNYFFVIANHGQGSAYDLNLELVDCPDSPLIQSQLDSIFSHPELRSESRIKLIAAIHLGSPITYLVRLTWKDSNGKSHTEDHHVTR